MPTSIQLDHYLLRILLYRRDASELLLQTQPEGLQLPAISIPKHTRVAEQLTKAITDLWNLDAYCLFPVCAADGSDPSTLFHVAELCGSNQDAPALMRWLPTTFLSAPDFTDPEDFTGIQAALAKLELFRRGELSGAFGKPGWLKGVTEWVRAQAAKVGLRLEGSFRQLNASPTFSLLRFETNGPALWFKAVGDPNLHEYRITLKLAAAFLDFVPRILASQPEWNAWLALESAGCQLDAEASESAWTTAVENLALLQISSFDRRFELISVGCKDLRPCSLLELVDPFLDAMAELMEQQTKIAPAPLSRQELVSLGSNITSALKEIGDSKIPSALGHLDMNPGNLLVSGQRSAFLDWAEAYVGPPFFTFQYLVEHWRQFYGDDSAHEAALLSEYARHWTRFASSEEIAVAFRVAPLLAAFAYAASSIRWRNQERIRPETARYLRSLTRRMKHEADVWSAGRRGLPTGFRVPELEAH